MAFLFGNDMFIKHITLQTGHSRNSGKSEISPEALALRTDLLTQCLLNQEQPIAIPNVEGYYLKAGNIGGKALFGSVWQGERPLITFVVATKSRNAAKLWHELHRHSTVTPVTDIDTTPPVPFIAVSLQVTADNESMGWLGDFERCLAWAWVSYE